MVTSFLFVCQFEYGFFLVVGGFYGKVGNSESKVLVVKVGHILICHPGQPIKKAKHLRW